SCSRTDEGFANDIGYGFIGPAGVSCEAGAETVELAPTLMDARVFHSMVLYVGWETSKSFRRALTLDSLLALLRCLLLTKGASAAVPSSSTIFGAAPVVNNGPA
ncbi:hypothetical protein Tco_0456846, partial [Tanacetum coccineum]